MIERYALPEMATLWTQQTKYETWLEVEIAVLQAQETLGLVPAGTTEAVKATAQFSASRIDEIEEEEASITDFDGEFNEDWEVQH